MVREMHIIVCMKITPKPEEVGVDYETKLLDRSNARSEINPPDMNAIEQALSLKDIHGAVVDILSMGPPFFEPLLRLGLAMGADHIYLLSDPAFGGADTLATTYTLAEAIKKIGSADLIVCGEESSDGATGQVPPGLAEWLGWNLISRVNHLIMDPERWLIRGRREVSGGFEVLQVGLPAVVSMQTASNEPRFMDYRLKDTAFEEDRLTLWNAQDLNAEPSHIGLAGSPTRVTGLAQAQSRERRREFLDGTPEQLVEQLAGLLNRYKPLD